MILELQPLITASLSIVGCSFILLSYFLFKKLQSPFGHLSNWFAVCGIGNALYPLLGSPSDGTPLCNFQAIIGSYFILCSVFTSTILATMILSLFNPQIATAPQQQSKITITYLHRIYVWLVPAILSLIPLATHTFGRDADLQCWIDTSDGESSKGVAMIFALFYGPLWICIIYTVSIYIYCVNRAMKMKGNIVDSKTESENKFFSTVSKLQWYPTILVVCWIIPTINRVLFMAGHDNHIIDHISQVTQNLPGFMDFVAYCFVSNAIQEWKKWLRPCVGGSEDSRKKDIKISTTYTPPSSEIYKSATSSLSYQHSFSTLSFDTHKLLQSDYLVDSLTHGLPTTQEEDELLSGVSVDIQYLIPVLDSSDTSREDYQERLLRSIS